MICIYATSGVVVRAKNQKTEAVAQKDRYNKAQIQSHSGEGEYSIGRD